MLNIFPSLLTKSIFAPFMFHSLSRHPHMKAERHKEERLIFIFKNSQNVESLQVDIGNSVTLHASRICKIAKTDFRKLVGLAYQERDLTARTLITIKSAKQRL